MPSIILPNKTPIGLSLPIRNAGVGFFEQTFDTFTQTKTNIINLLRTIPGERRMQPLFGCRLHKSVFEQNTEILPDYIKNIIKEDINNWVSNVSIDKIDVKFLKNEESVSPDSYKIYISVKFIVNTVNQSGTVNFTIDTNQF